MKNFILDDDILTLSAAPAALTGGSPYLMGALLVVPLATVASGAPVAVATKGVFNVTKLTADVVTLGQKLYWDNTNFRLTTTVGSNILVGVAVQAATSSDTTVLVRLDGVTR